MSSCEKGTRALVRRSVAKRALPIFFLAAVASAASLAGCTIRSPEERAVIAWIEKRELLYRDGPWAGRSEALSDEEAEELRRLRKHPEEWIAQGRQLQDVEGVLRRLLRRNDKGVDLPTVAFALSYLRSSEGVPELIGALRSDSGTLRIRAIVSLGNIGDKRAVEPLCRVLAKGDHFSLRANAAGALGRLGGEESTGGLGACST